jgi:hypothetical protein
MKQAFGMAEAALEAIGNPPDNNANAKWRFPEPESRDMAARIFGTDFDVTVDYEYENPMRQTVNKYQVIRGTAVPLTICTLDLHDPRHILLAA